MSAEGALVRRERPYSAFWRFDGVDSAMPALLDQLGSWLREKGVDVDLAESGRHRAGPADLLVLHNEHGGAQEFHVRLVEHNRSGVWSTELTARGDREAAGWLRLVVSCDGDRFVSAPRLAGYLLESGEYRDGATLRLGGAPKVLRQDDVNVLVDALVDPTREGILFVAGSDALHGLPFDPWVRKVRSWTKEVTGLADVVVLDPWATAAFAAAVGGELRVHPWSIRTFRPGVRSDFTDEARQHRYLTPSSLGGWSDAKIRTLLGRISREQAAHRELPEEVRRTLRGFGRLETRYFTESLRSRAAVVQPEPASAAVEVPAAVVQVAAQPPVAEVEPIQGLVAEISGYLHQLELVKRVLGVTELSETELRRIVDAPRSLDSELLDAVDAELQDKQAAIETLNDTVESLRASLEVSAFDLAVEVEERAKAQDLARYLQSRLAAAQDFDAAYGPAPDEAATVYPDSFDALVASLTAGSLVGVGFTGDRKLAADLDEHDALDTALRMAWEVCLALADYVRYRGEGKPGGVDRYLKNCPAGFRGVPPNKHAPTESDTVLNNAAMAGERTFPVPVEVDPDSKRLMAAHFKLALVGSISPRLHYLDDTNGTGKVYIGYIGPHLTNTKTN